MEDEKPIREDDASARRSGRYSLPDMAYGRIIASVIDGRFPVNSRMPSELTLASELGVSRPILRIALNRLKSDGIIVSRQGSGNFVIRQPHQAVLLFSPPPGIGEVQNGFKFRIGVEGEAAYYAAMNHDQASMNAITRALSNLQRAVLNRESGVEEDFGFHLRVAEASDNPYFVTALTAVREPAAFGMSITRHLSLRRSRARLNEVDAEHEDIHARIQLRDAEGARTAMRTHLENARRRLFESDLLQNPTRGNEER